MVFLEDKIPSYSLLAPEIEYEKYEEDEDERIAEAKKPPRISLLVRFRCTCRSFNRKSILLHLLFL